VSAEAETEELVEEAAEQPQEKDAADELVEDVEQPEADTASEATESEAADQGEEEDPWAEALAAIPHIRRLRVHTRLPVVIPQRVSDSLIAWLSGSRLQSVVVIHVNHPAELDADTQQALGRLKAAGVTLLNQSVILKGVNDNARVLAELSERLFECGVLPYYLHAFDPVAGAHHFEVSDDKARDLVRQLITVLPGFLVPRLVREIPGQPGKTPLDLFA